jgi:Terminase-like family.
VLTWWCGEDERYEAVICDGAVRSGKTLSMGLSFFCWAMRRFDGRQFALCGKTISALRRNLLQELLPQLERLGFHCRERRAENVLTVRFGNQENRFCLFGGRDESSAALIQGSTFAGVLLDEAALMPRSFVEQACARCSVSGSKLWFNCNPDGLTNISSKY